MRTRHAKEVNESLKNTAEEPSRGPWARMAPLSGSSGTFLDNQVETDQGADKQACLLLLLSYIPTLSPDQKL